MSKVQVAKREGVYSYFSLQVCSLLTWCLKCYRSQGTAARGAASLLSDTVPFCSVQQFLLVLFVVFFLIVPKLQFHGWTYIYPLLGEQGRSAVWGSRWCRWVRKCCFSSLMGCLTWNRYLCLCFFSCEVGGAILTDLKSAGIWSGQHGTVAMQLTRLKDIFHSKHCFHLEKSPSISGFPPLPSSISHWNSSCVKSSISSNCSVWSWKLFVAMN